MRKKGHTGMVPVIGWDGKNEWKGEIPFEEMPHTFNPEQGFIVTCNNKMVDDDYPHYLGNAFMNGYRAKRITDFIQSKEKISINDCKKMQLDFYSIPGLQLLEHYRDIELNDKDEKVNQALDIFKSWDGYLTSDSVGGAIYSVVKYMAVRHLFEPNLGVELTETLMGTGFHPILMPAHEFYGHDVTILLKMLDNPNSWWINSCRWKGKDAKR